MSDPTLLLRDYNMRPRQCQTPGQLFSCETAISGANNVRPPKITIISGPEHDTRNVRPHAFRIRDYYDIGHRIT